MRLSSIRFHFIDIREIYKTYYGRRCEVTRRARVDGKRIRKDC
nr:MAG TPA: hypothetical protein [Caudoviricetes sp.]